jgi:hypothetical protein
MLFALSAPPLAHASPCRPAQQTVDVCHDRLASQLTSSGEYVTPSELFYGQRPDMSHMIAFGAPCLVALQGPALRAHGKLQLRSVPGKILHHCMEGIQRDGGG